MLRRVLIVSLLVLAVSACAQLAALHPVHDTPYTRAIDTLATNSGDSTFLFVESQRRVHVALGNLEKAIAIVALKEAAFIEERNGIRYYRMDGMQKVNEYINANPADYDTFLAKGSVDQILDVTLGMSLALYCTKVAIGDMQALSSMTPEGPDAVHADEASDTMSFATSSQQAQLTALSTLVPRLTDFLSSKGVDVSNLVNNANAASQVADFLK
ncbi:MAG: hypothetical protein LBV04_01990 [Deferribacteraceae bacterium]|jgi:hypothetical protein|nr:hypothetical protein [Deferribacteraceae bacterium]